MRNKKFLLVFLSLILLLAFASCGLIHECSFSEEWKYDETNHWHECECGLKNEEGAHTFGEWQTNEKGEKERVCDVCGYEEIEPVEEHKHSYSTKWSKDNNYHWYACNGCNVPSEKSEHSWNEGVETTPATETTVGVKVFTCTVCDATKEEEIPMLEHIHTVDDATWNNDETHHWHPSTCGHENEVGDKAEHNWNAGVETKAPTCSEVGVMTFTCETCKKTKTEDIEKNSHTPETLAAVVSTCTKTGLTEGSKCSVCGEILTAQEEIPAKGHSYVASYVWSDDYSTCTATLICANDASHAGETEAATVSTVTLTVTASKVTYTYNVAFANESLTAQSKSVDGEISLTENIAIINAPSVANRVPSHDYVKFDLQNAEETHEFTIHYSELVTWDGTTVSESLSGSGTEADPYLIQSGADLAWLDQNMTSAENFKGVYFKLTKTIDLGGNSVKIGEYPGWGGRKIFSGIFDGNNCSIRGLNMTESGKGAGLFSVVSGTVKNLTVYGAVAGDDLMTGGIVGWLYNGKLENCTNYVNVTSTAASETGAMVGTCQTATMTNCINYGSVVGIDSVGGIAGKASGTLTDCYNYGSVSGCTSLNGIYGSAHSSGTPTLTNSKDYGAIVEHKLTRHEAKSNSCEEAGNVEYYNCSVCGNNYDAEGNKLSTVEIPAIGHAWDEGTISEGIITFTCGNCSETKQENAVYTITVNHLYLDGTTAADAETLEYAYNTSYTVNAKTIEGYVASHDYVKGQILGENQTITIYYSEVDVWDGTTVSESLSGSGTEADPYLIQSGADLAYFAKVVNEHTIEGTTKDHASREVYTVFTGKYFKLTKSIDLNNNSLKIGYSLAWNNYSRFGGNFDGNNCSIRGLSITQADTNRNDALFGMVYAGTIKNLSVYGSVYGGGVLNGGVVGYLVSGTVENCTSYVDINGNNETGGIVGNLEKGTIINCINYGKVTCTGASAGTICGKNASGTITDCTSFTELNQE